MTADIERLIEAYLEDSLDAEDQEKLRSWLNEDPGNMQALVEAGMRDQMLHDAASAVFVAEEIHSVAKQANEESVRTLNDPSGAWIPRWRLSRRSVGIIAGLAACVLVAFLVYQRLTPQPNGVANIENMTQVKAFSTVTMVPESESDLQVGDRLSSESIRIAGGILRLQFDDGVEVTIQGPAVYELIEPGTTRLHSGLLTANVPPGAEGFRVDTPSAKVVDLGTAFGIELTPDGQSRVSVFDGEVEVISNQGSDKRLLSEGDSLELSLDGRMQETEFSTQQFEKLWPATSGIVGSTGAFRFAPQWPRMLKKIESNRDIFVLPEGYAKELEQPCPVDVSSTSDTPAAIGTGQRVRSFLLQFNPIDEGEAGPGAGSGPGPGLGPGPGVGPGTGLGPGRRNGKRIQGSITFERPILGLITKTETLKQTDVLFSLSRAGMMPGRGLEERPPRLADIVSLSDDRCTLTLDLFVVNRLSDHVRVIVDANLHELAER
ncbi:MAG: FecR family protein [Planctomycetota bacterium]